MHWIYGATREPYHNGPGPPAPQSSSSLKPSDKMRAPVMCAREKQALAITLHLHSLCMRRRILAVPCPPRPKTARLCRCYAPFSRVSDGGGVLRAGSATFPGTKNAQHSPTDRAPLIGAELRAPIRLMTKCARRIGDAQRYTHTWSKSVYECRSKKNLYICRYKLHARQRQFVTKVVHICGAWARHI